MSPSFKKSAVFPHCWSGGRQAAARGAMDRSPWVAVDASTIPATRARELRDAWEDFVDGRALDSSEDAGTPQVRVPIADSWLRSRDAGVDPSGRQPAPSVLELPESRARWQGHPLARAGPLIEECMATA